MAETIVSTDEKWLPVVGHEGLYSVSSCGRIRRDSTNHTHRAGKILGGTISTDGYLSVCIRKDGTYKRHRVNRLVARAFIGEFNGLVVNHKDGNKLNNTVDNLELVTVKENTHHYLYQMGGIENHRGEKHGMSRLTNELVLKARQLSGDGASNSEIARRFGVHHSRIQRVIAGKAWVHVK